MAITKPKPEDITPAIKRAVAAYLLARVYAETVREQIDAIYTDCLRIDGRWLYKTEPKHPKDTRPVETITKPKDAWLMSNEDFKDYHAECQHQLKKHNWKVPEGYCPALMAENTQRLAGRVLIESAEPVFGIDPHRLLCAGVKKYEQYIDLLCGLVVSLPDWATYQPSIPTR